MRHGFLGQRGFSIVQVMIAFGLMGGLALALMNLAQQQSKQQLKADTDFTLLELQKRIQDVLANSDACTSTLGGLRPGEFNTAIRTSKIDATSGKSVVFLEADATRPEQARYGNSGISFVSIKLPEIKTDAKTGKQNYTSAGGGYYQVDAEVNLMRSSREKAEKHGLGASETIRKVSVKVMMCKRTVINVTQEACTVDHTCPSGGQDYCSSATTRDFEADWDGTGVGACMLDCLTDDSSVIKCASYSTAPI